MQTVLVLLALLLAVPLQLFLSHYINATYPGSSVVADSAVSGEESPDPTGKVVSGDINSVRMEALHE